MPDYEQGPTVFLEILIRFKKFLFENLLSIGQITAVSIALIIILSFALREIFSWLLGIKSLRQELRSLKSEIQVLQKDIRSISPNLASKDIKQNQEPETQESQTRFNLNH